MITRQEYLSNPCKAAALPYWKEKTFNLPEHMKVVHANDFTEEYLQNYNDTLYFRIYHAMQHIEQNVPNGFCIETAKVTDIPTIVEVINKSYTDIQVTLKQIENYTKTQVYNQKLWILIRRVKTNEVVGCGIADVDKEIGEGILEWIQVLPQYRKQGVGSLIVNELLYRMKDYVKFVTVSGQVDNITSPEALYRKCGFVGEDVWHILFRK